MSNVTSIPVPEVEEYVTGPELARRMGVSYRTVKKMTKDGMPSETWGRRVRRYRPSLAMAWARQQGFGS